MNPSTTPTRLTTLVFVGLLVALFSLHSPGISATPSDQTLSHHMQDDSMPCAGCDATMVEVSSCDSVLCVPAPVVPHSGYAAPATHARALLLQSIPHFHGGLDSVPDPYPPKSPLTV